MSKIEGIFWMQTPGALYNKIVKEAKRIEKDPLDSDACFNFFVCAEHLPEWTYPGSSGAVERKKIRKLPLLRLCSQIANGAKHFTTDDPRHKSIKSTSVETIVWVNERDTRPAEPRQEFVIHLNQDEITHFGSNSLNVREIVKQILNFWEPRAKGPLFK